MKTQSKLFLASMALFLAFTFTSCDKDEEPKESTVATTPQVEPPSDAFGLLAAVKSYSEGPSIPGVPAIDIEIGVGVAAFIDGDDLLSAGTVTLNNSTLTKQSNNSYTFTPSLTDPMGITFENGRAAWTVSGEGSVPAISESHTGFPSKPTITSSTTVETSNGYTLTWTGGASSDSILVSIIGSNDAASKTVAGGTTSVNFSADDLSNVGSTSFGVLQVAAYKISKRVVSDKNIYLVNQSTATEAGVDIN